MGFFELFSAALAGLYAVVPVYGVAIILLTILVRVLLLPLTVKQTRSMREMQLVQPEIKKIQQKHKGNRQEMNQAMMELYREHNINPLGGCLPLILQMPVFIALFRVLSTPLAYMGYDARGRPGSVEGPMEWLQGSALAQGLLEVPERVNSFLAVIRLDCSPSAIVAGGDAAQGVVPCPEGILPVIPYVALIALMGGSQFFQQRQMMAQRGPGTDPQMQQQQAIMKFMPLLFVVFGFSFPAGLTLYWTVSNIWTIGQQAMMFRMIGPHPTLEKAAGDKTSAKGKTSPKGAAPAKDNAPASSGPKGGGERSGRRSKKKAAGRSPHKKKR